MAPMPRNSPRASRESNPPISREASWHFVESEMASAREASEDPGSFYDEPETALGLSGRRAEKRGQLAQPAHEDILHPLREAANRVGREVERFAEVLDGYNPLTAATMGEKHEMAFDIIDLYHGIALDTLERLREQHAAEKRRKDGLRWRKKMRGLKITRDEDEMNLEEPDDIQYGSSLTNLEDLERWEQETQTWELLRRLAPLRFPATRSTQNGTDSTSPHTTLHGYSTERDVWEGFLEGDGLALERQTVLEWLKDSAEGTGENIDVLVRDLQQNAERGDIIAHGWLHTKAAIKNQKRIHLWPDALHPMALEAQNIRLSSSKTGPIITQLDPDAMTRQDRKLEAQDGFFERSIWLGCYEMLRRGRCPQEIREWCMERTEIWRAVSMSGLPDEKATGDNETGNPSSSALWRRMCFALAQKGGGDEYERAVYGILSGDVSSVEDVCRSWDDLVFVHYNALLKAQFDSYLHRVYPERAMAGQFTAFGTIQFHGNSKTAEKKLIETLETDARTSAESLQPMKMLQGALLADQFGTFIYQQGLALSKFANAHNQSNLIPITEERLENDDLNRYVSLDDHDSLRVLTHVLLAFISLGLDLGGVHRQTVIENVIVSYISFLRLSGKEELIPLYCSQLSGNRRYATLSRNLIDVTDPEQRVTQVKLMRELGLDVQEFVKFQSRYLFADFPDNSDGYPASNNFKLLEGGTNPSGIGRRLRRDFFGDDPDEIERADRLFIRSLEWYLLVDGLWSETFVFGTMLYMRFFKHMHLAAARTLASTVSSSIIAQSKTRAILGQTLNLHDLESWGEDRSPSETPSGSVDPTKLLGKHLLAEMKNFRQLETLVGILDSMETVTSMSYLLHEQSSPQWQAGWRQELGRTVRQTESLVQALLKGWLLSSQQEENQFQLLREAYLPETVLAYVKTLQLAGTILSRDFLMKCMDLSTHIAAQDSDLSDLFIKTGRMQELVEAFAFAGKTLLVITSVKGSTGSKSKKLRAMGWTPELWSVRP